MSLLERKDVITGVAFVTVRTFKDRSPATHKLFIPGANHELSEEHVRCHEASVS